MTSIIAAWLADVPWMRLFELLIDMTLKGAAVCAIAGIATLFLRRASASTRNMVWVFALIVLILLPALALVSPVWNLSIIPEPGSWAFGSYASEYEKLDPASSPGRSALGGTEALKSAADAGASVPADLPWYAWGILAWLGGGGLLLCWCLISHAGVGYIVKRARPASLEWGRLLAGVSKELRLTRPVRLLESVHIKSAITVGILDPAVILPSDSAGWPENRRKLVLSHELAHVKRWDTLVETLASCATVVYWFNPLVWFAVKQLRIERERDCDNAVLGTGAKPSDYAELLMHIAAGLGDSARPAWQLSTISQSSNLKERIMNILNQNINRTRGSRRSAVLTGALVLALALPISTSGLWNVQAQEKSKEQEKKAQIEKMKQHELQEKARQEADTEKKKEQELKSKDMKMSAEEKLKAGWEKMCANENSAACRVAKAMKSEGADGGVKTFLKLKEAGEGEYYFDEKEFNTAGYLFLYDKKMKEAMAIFELNVKEYPDSWNVYDSLGEACLAAGRIDEAEKNYQTALKMNPEAASAQKALQKIEMKREKSSS